MNATMNEAALLQNSLSVGAALFSIGLVGFFSRRNMIVMFLCAEMMLQGVSVSLVAWGRYHNDWGGQMLVIFILTVAACEAAIALALVLMLFQRRGGFDIAAWHRPAREQSARVRRPRIARGSRAAAELAAADARRHRAEGRTKKKRRTGVMFDRNVSANRFTTDAHSGLPLAASLLLAFFGRVFGKLSHLPVVLAFGASFVLSVMLLFDVQAEMKQQAGGENAAGIGCDEDDRLRARLHALDLGLCPGCLYTSNRRTARRCRPLWARRASFDITVSLRADPLTAIMLSMVTFISTLVAIYSVGYMHGDPGYWRFFTYIALFVFSMTMLVSVSNFVLLYVFWEAVGVCSYLLIGFWYQKPEAAAAGKKAFLVNRVGDFGFAWACS